ncbi:ferredoxin-fold anticodon-binding domain-containing protein 1 [Eublepharis macularius]|uniref:phenylalanine--tRNA ligase n=1 Tax=Eublepharis macularius TaxID=481883 RepID=A0AA97KBD5_EUBMA|nr:ferredoxin-fold anticodon-binding domain-containing protein 1 [Eublepharis macularius]XP_054853889.1 ferredoxin-fold anticodon-binding domain-containing protein 1 [Eublepharis macularius]XP_054853890.1 ferredoxin-fold anticodon-binding domain-containing protein 1 [Eublepharis macularius]
MRSLHPQKRLLFVGEGNFSFSASLCKVKGDETHIVATCYETEDVISRQALAKTNIQYLRDRGAEVHFCVDCTKLKERFLPAEGEFDCIYFNFPHRGRKVGVKKNKELLARFFCSCADVLAEKGEVHVALCRGQGGTPADQPMREWHNSWQVVAMAAEAGFILNDVHPFNTRDASGYKCTGYRSQDKSFCVEGALNHIFTRRLPLPVPRPLICQAELEGKLVSFLVPEIFQDKINRDFLDMNSDHPVRTVNEKLIDGLGKRFPILKVNCSHSLVFQDRCNSSFSLDALWMVPVSEGNPNPKSAVKKTVRDTETFPSAFPGWDDTDQGNHLRNQDWLLGQYYLRPSLLVSLPTVLQQTECPPETLLALSGPVFRKCKISPCALPVYHEALFICVVNSGLEDTHMQLLVESLTGTLNPWLQDAGFKLGCTTDEPDAAAGLSAFVTSEMQLHKLQYLTTSRLDTSDPKPKDGCVGTIGTVPWQSASTDLRTVYASLNLDLLAMHVCGICDWRMLWTSDERFLKQFSGGNVDSFKSFSLYPPSYVHDLSFWVPELERFNETQLHAIVRRTSCDSVVSVQLLDRFQHPDTAQTSLCYRLTYQSCDKGLARQQAAAMQMKLRKEIQRSLHVTLR